MKQLAFFPRPKRPRVWRMHVYDAGTTELYPYAALFWCRRCGHKTEWLEITSITAAKRGLPCPICNPEK